MRSPRAAVGNVAVVCVFLILALNAIFVRANVSATMGQFEKSGMFNSLPLCEALIPCMRAGLPLVATATLRLFDGLASLSFTDLDNSSFALPSQFSHHEPTGDQVRRFVTAPAAWLIIHILPLTAILAASFLLFRYTKHRIAFVAITLFALAGWNPLLTSAFFRAVNFFFEWPNPYFLFSIAVPANELWVTGFLFCLTIFFANRGETPRLQVAVAAALGQLFMENVGMAVTVAIFTYTMLVSPSTGGPRPWRAAIERSAFAAIASVLMAGILAYIVLKNATGPAKLYEGSTVPRLLDIFAWHWQQYGLLNFSKWPFLFGNLITLLFYPALFGGVLGWFAARGAERDLSTLYREWSAAAAIAIGFLSTLFVGMFISGMMSDLGRQAAPLVCMAVPLSAKSVELWRRRRLMFRPA